MQAIVNGRLILPDEQGEFQTVEHQVLIYDHRIKDILPEAEFAAEQGNPVEEIYDAQGAYVSPGFINVHLHGCDGFDVMDEAAEALAAIGRFQLKTGVTAMLPTTMTYDLPRIYQALERIRAVQGKEAEGAVVLGAHLEGPFINKDRRGAQKAEHIIPPDFALIKKYADVLRLITIAPEELQGDYSFVEQCGKNGIVVSLGHSNADYDTAVQAVSGHGIRHITHLFNAMNGLQHREPGLVGAALDSAADCELIADNVHVHPMMQRLVWQAKKGKNIILITDSMRACGLADGESELGGQRVFVKGCRATLADGTIAGSVLTMDRAIANFAANTGAALPEVISCVTKAPAIGLGIYADYGSLAKGKRADITVFDDEIRIKAVFVGGKKLYDS